MSDGIDPQVQTAQLAGNTVESAPTEQTPVVEQKVSDPLSVPSESSSETQSTLAIHTEPAKTPEQTGSEPVAESQVVEELKKVRRRAQQAEQELRQKAEEAANLRGQLEERNKQTQVSSPQKASGYDGTKPPQVNDFESYDDFMKESIKYDLRKEEEQKRAKEHQGKIAERQKEIDRDFYSRVAKVQSEKLPDYDEVIRSASINLSNEVLQAIKESEVGPEVAYHLAKNPEVITKINQMSLPSAVREIGKIEAKLTTVEPVKKQTKQVSQAPEPIKPVNAAASPVTVEPDKMSTEDWMQRRIAETTVKVGNRVRLKRV